MMADPLSSAELDHARWLAANRPDVTSSVVARLLATLDEAQAIIDGRGETLTALRSELERVKADRERWPSIPRTHMQWRAWWRDIPEDALRQAPPAVQAALLGEAERRSAAADQSDAQERSRRSIEGWVEAGRRGWTGYSGARGGDR